MKDITITTILVDSTQTPKAKIDQLVKLAYAAIAEAEVLAETNDCPFRFELTYGAGATFTEDWNASSLSEDGSTPWAWMASSQSC